MGASSKKLEDATLTQNKVTQELNLTTSFFSNILGIILYIATGLLILKNVIPFGVISVVSDFKYYLSCSISDMVEANGYIRGVKSLNKSILNDSKQEEFKGKASTISPNSFFLKDVSLKFANGETLNFPDFEVRKGEKILLAGNSGVGKSTLLKIIKGKIVPDTGEILFRKDNQVIEEPNINSIGYLPQDAILFPVSLIDNMTMFNNKLTCKANQMVKDMQLEKDIYKNNLDIENSFDPEKPNISGGQMQKIVLIRTLIHDNKIILIDEGTSAIDKTSTLEILKNINSLPQTILFVAHNLNSEMIELFDRKINLK